MQKLAGAVFLVILCALAFAGTASAVDTCATAVIRGSASGTLSITEYAATAVDPSRCPRGSDILGSRFSRTDESDFFLWMRFEGDAAYLQKARAADPISVEVRKKGDHFSFNDFFRIGNPYIQVDKMVAEVAASPEGRFDWRFDIHFLYVPQPGIYTVTLTQGGRKICTLWGACSISLEVF